MIHTLIDMCAYDSRSSLQCACGLTIEVPGPDGKDNLLIALRLMAVHIKSSKLEYQQHFLDFAVRMLMEIEANDHKGDWAAWTPHPHKMMEEIDHHVNKLRFTLGKPDQVTELSADIANYMMKSHELTAVLDMDPNILLDELRK